MKVLVLLLLMFSTIKAASVDWYMELGLGFGGNEPLGEVRFYNAPSESMYAGDGTVFHTGVRFRPPSKSNFQNFATTLSLGIIYDDIEAENGDVTYIRYPVTLMQYYVFTKWQVGAGLSYHLNPRVGGDGFADDASIDLDSELGGVFEVSYRFLPHIHLGVQFSAQDYTVKDEVVDANRFGLVLRMGLPIREEKVLVGVGYKEEGVEAEPKREIVGGLHAQTIQSAVVVPEESTKSAQNRPYKKADREQLGTSKVEDDDFDNFASELIGSSIEGSSYTTSGDDEKDIQRRGKEFVPRYISDNMDTMAIEIASGSGETLDALTTLLEIEDREAFYTRLKENFTYIYHDSSVHAAEVYERIVALR